ncbi:MAG: hypothetical protein R3327_08235 [Nitrosopumilaceae archaeon]|nr:hypothetical protein [Nitrosopumilaceae archaeon]
MKQGIEIFDHVLRLKQQYDSDYLYSTIACLFSVIPECHIDTLESLYNGNVNGDVICKK